MIDLNREYSQSEFGALVGISQPAVSDLLARGVLRRGDSASRWLLDYCRHLREVAAGRATADASIDLPTERALLARAQREGQDIKNAVARGTYAPIDALTDVLSNAAQSAVDHFDQIPAGINRVCPDLPQPVRDLVMTEIARARNEMVRKTASLIADTLESFDIQEDDSPDASPGAD